MSGDYIDDILHTWALWAFKNKGPAGYSAQTILYRVARDGALIKGTGQAPDPEAPEEMVIDAIVTKLRAEHSPQWAVLVKHYLDKGTPKQKQKDLAIGHSTYYARLSAAQRYVERALEERSRVLT